MKLRLSLLLSAILLAGPTLAPALAPALAQGFQPAPSQGFGPPPAQQNAGPSPFDQPQQEPPCLKDFIAMRDDANKKGLAIRAASQRHAPIQEACRLLNALMGSEEKLVKYAEGNATWCGIPQQVVAQIKTSHSNTAALRNRVCEAAARPAAPAAPTLSDALGTNIVPNQNNIKSGRGTYDTLTGNPLGK